MPHQYAASAPGTPDSSSVGTSGRLGERRALAVREELIRLGIGATEVDTTSYGKDKPAVDGHDEAAWSKNRRDDFVVLSPLAK